MRVLGIRSLGLALRVLGLKLLLVEDHTQMARIKLRLVPRDERHVRIDTRRPSIVPEAKMKMQFFAALGRAGGHSRAAKLTR